MLTEVLWVVCGVYVVIGVLLALSATAFRKREGEDG